jgi:hypothetical protein
MKPEFVPLIEYIQSLEPTNEWRERNGLRFGLFMRQWRLKMGWTQYTANDYGQHFGFSTISYGNLSVIEQGKAGELRYKVYYQLGRLNEKHFSVAGRVIHCCSSHKITKKEQEAINYLRLQRSSYQLKHSPSP